MIGSNHSDTLKGNRGDNIIEGGRGSDTIKGSSGNDTASYVSSDAAVTINLLADTATGGHADGDELDSIESLIGSAHNDTLTGDAKDNVFEGAAALTSWMAGMG